MVHLPLGSNDGDKLGKSEGSSDEMEWSFTNMKVSTIRPRKIYIDEKTN